MSSSGLRIATYAWGDPAAPVILAAHGGFDFAGTFDVFAPLLVDGGYQVVSWDARGHGCSERAVLYSWAADLRDAAAVLGSIDRAQVVLLGHSKGAGLMLDLAHTLPHRFTHLVNLDGLPSKNNWPDVADHERTKMLRGELEGWLEHRRRVADGQRKPATLEGLAQRRQQMNPRLSIEWLEYLVTIGAREDADGWRWRIDPSMRLGGFGPWRPEWSMQRLPGIGVPVLGVLGLQREVMGWGTLPATSSPTAPRCSASRPSTTSATSCTSSSPSASPASSSSSSPSTRSDDDADRGRGIAKASAWCSAMPRPAWRWSERR